MVFIFFRDFLIWVWCFLVVNGLFFLIVVMFIVINYKLLLDFKVSVVVIFIIVNSIKFNRLSLLFGEV